MVGSSPPSSISWSPDTTANWPFAANSSVDFGTPSADSIKGTIFFAIVYCHLATSITSSKAAKRICQTFLRFVLTVYQPRLILSPLKYFNQLSCYFYSSSWLLLYWLHLLWEITRRGSHFPGCQGFRLSSWLIELTWFLRSQQNQKPISKNFKKEHAAVNID